MTVGKAGAHPPDVASTEGFTFVAPCLTHIDEPAVAELLERDHFFWLDLTAPTAEDIQKLGEVFGFHPLALEDAEHFGQRPKLDNYQEYALLVFYGAQGEVGGAAALQEVQMFVSGKYLLTLHRDRVLPLEEQRARLTGVALHSEQFLLYRVFDALTDSFFPVLARMDDEIDELEDAILSGPTDEQLQRLFAMKRDLVAMRKVVTPQRDLFARSIDQLAALPGLQLDERDYFRDVYDHLIRISDLIDSYRDLLSGSTDLYLSTVGTRQNEVMKQLAIVGTIFLPLSFITGFFGMNFSWMINKGIASTWSFFVLGIGSILVTCALLVRFFKRKGWM
ncbi:MAG: magnesium and cobalt transport protein CorA [Solirubrobacterales bacterium]|nr:magnesium and cobalt transport protein CorA [Solirubrobacterales bacterium]